MSSRKSSPSWTRNLERSEVIMPSDRRGGRGRGSIVNWRVKCGKKEVFSKPMKVDCTTFIRENQKKYDKKLRLIPPNY
jgi:hypothetical protein